MLAARLNDLIIRAATLTDVAAVAELTTELGYPATTASVRQRLGGLLTREDRFVAVAVFAGRVGGWLQAHAYVTLETGYRAEIVGLIVAERYRRSGAGRLLVEAAERWARERGTETIVVRSNVNRAESHRFYPALGFTRTKTQAVYRKSL